MKTRSVHPILAVVMLAGLMLGLAACGDDSESSGGTTTAAASEPADTTTDAGGGAEGGQSCPDVEADSHIDTEVMVSGTDCDAVTDVILAAEGQGRQPYESGGFACEPMDRDDGSTDYTCEADDGVVVVTFNHMAA